MDASVSRPVWIPARPNMMPVRRRGISESRTLGVANRRHGAQSLPCDAMEHKLDYRTLLSRPAALV